MRGAIDEALHRRIEREIERVVPDLDALLASPADRLSAGPVIIGEGRVFWLTLLLAPLLALLVGYYTYWDDTAMAVAFAGGLAVPLLLVALGPKRELRLFADRVEMSFSNRFVSRTVVTPWALFRAGGVPVELSKVGVALAIDASAVDAVELRDGDRVLARGGAVKSPLFQFRNGNEVELTGMYAAPITDIGWLLLRLGPMLGGERIAEVPDRAPEPERATHGFHPASEGWTTLQLTRTQFARQCCGCGVPTDSIVEYESHEWWTVLVTILRFSPGYVTLPIPTCEACGRGDRRTGYARTALVVLAIALAIGAIPLGVAMHVPELLTAMPLLSMFFVVPGGLYLSRRLDAARLTDYSSSKGTVKIAFRDPRHVRMRGHL